MLSPVAQTSTTNLDAEAELAIPLTFKIDPVRGIPRRHFQTMTVETYNRLLKAHAARRDELISAVNRAKTPPSNPAICSCGNRFYMRLSNSIGFAIWAKPFLDRQRFDSYLPDSAYRVSTCGLGQTSTLGYPAKGRWITLRRGFG